MPVRRFHWAPGTAGSVCLVVAWNVLNRLCTSIFPIFANPCRSVRWHEKAYRDKSFAVSGGVVVGRYRFRVGASRQGCIVPFAPGGAADISFGWLRLFVQRTGQPRHQSRGRKRHPRIEFGLKQNDGYTVIGGVSAMRWWPPIFCSAFNLMTSLDERSQDRLLSRVRISYDVEGTWITPVSRHHPVLEPVRKLLKFFTPHIHDGTSRLVMYKSGGPADGWRGADACEPTWDRTASQAARKEILLYWPPGTSEVPYIAGVPNCVTGYPCNLLMYGLPSQGDPSAICDAGTGYNVLKNPNSRTDEGGGTTAFLRKDYRCLSRRPLNPFKKC